MRLIAAILLLLPVPLAAQGLPEGAYRVKVEIVLPNISTREYDFETRICWRGAEDPRMPLGPLGPGPLRDCGTEARDLPGGVSVRTTCEGPNAGWANSSYRATPAGFSGQISINLGGKNMTLGERHRGEFLGPCTP